MEADESEAMTDNDQYPDKIEPVRDPEVDRPDLKPWVTPEFTLVGDLKNAQVGNGNPTDFKLKGPKNPPGQS